MKSCFTFLFGIFISAAALCQSPAETEVMKPINDLFLGMKKGDSALVHSAFMKRVTFVTVSRDKASKPVFRNDDLQEFLNAIGKPHADVWNELIWDIEIKIDGDLAQVWAKFAFHLNKKFNHCGVDAFQLFRGPDGKWRIFNLSDTHQKESCVVPPNVTAQLD